MDEDDYRRKFKVSKHYTLEYANEAASKFWYKFAREGETEDLFLIFGVEVCKLYNCNAHYASAFG